MKDKELSITAALACMELSEEETRRLGKEVTGMLEYFSRMMEVDISALEPTTHALLKTTAPAPTVIRIIIIIIITSIISTGLIIPTTCLIMYRKPKTGSLSFPTYSDSAFGSSKYPIIFQLHRGNYDRIHESLERALREHSGKTAYLSTVKAADKKIGAFLQFDPDRSIKNAENTGFFSGIPFAVKDNIAVEGFNLTCGSKMLRKFRVAVYCDCRGTSPG